MSSAVFSTSAAQGRPFAVDSENGVEVCPEPSQQELFTQARPPHRIASADLSKTLISRVLKDARHGSVTPASRLAVRPAPEMVSSGIAAIDQLTGGLPRGCLTEICGPASSGRGTLMLSTLAAATRRGEFCAVVDASDALDPQSVAAAGIELDRLLWVRCGEKSHYAEPRLEQHRLEQLLRVSDLLLESGGFGLIALDLGDLPPQMARRIPLATWFRFRRAVEHTSTVLLAVERQSIAGSCSSLLIKLGLLKLGSLNLGSSENLANVPTHAQLLTNVEITAELVRSRMERKQARSAEVTFASKTAWAG
jgi:recombination protein RecA